MNQKILLAILALSVCFIMACGNASTSSSSSEGSESIVGPAACYMGEGERTCVTLKSLNATAEGYLNPFTDPSFMANGNKEQYRKPIQGVDLKKTSPNLKIAPNFIVSEFMSLEKGSFGIFSTEIVKIIQELRNKTGSFLKIHSAFRSPKWNEGIDGSAKWSRHQYGDAIDFSSSTASLDKLITYCRELGATYVDKYATHVHCDWRATKVEPSFFGQVESPQLKQFSVHDTKINAITDMQETSMIHITGSLTAGSIILLKSTVTYQEDLSELYKKWIIKSPNGDEVILEQAEVSLYLEKGTYQITHIIGANVELHKTFFVN